MKNRIFFVSPVDRVLLICPAGCFAAPCPGNSLLRYRANQTPRGGRFGPCTHKIGINRHVLKVRYPTPCRLKPDIASGPKSARSRLMQRSKQQQVEFRADSGWVRWLSSLPIGAPTLTHTNHAIMSARECDERVKLPNIFS